MVEAHPIRRDNEDDGRRNLAAWPQNRGSGGRYLLGIGYPSLGRARQFASCPEALARREAAKAEEARLAAVPLCQREDKKVSDACGAKANDGR